jgi:hypothetical protein
MGAVPPASLPLEIRAMSRRRLWISLLVAVLVFGALGVFGSAQAQDARVGLVAVPPFLLLALIVVRARQVRVAGSGDALVIQNWGRRFVVPRSAIADFQVMPSSLMAWNAADVPAVHLIHPDGSAIPLHATARRGREATDLSRLVSWLDEPG